MSVAAGSSRGSSGSDEVEVSGRGRGIRCIDLPAVFTTPQERELLGVVTAFDLSRNELETLTSLQPLRSLCRLNASYNRIHRVDGLPLRLTQLNLAHNRLEHLDPVGELVHLRELDVSFNRLTSLAGLHPRVPLEVLRADDNRIDRTTGLEELRTLRVVSLSNNYIEDLDELLFLPSTPRLQMLSLIGNPVTRARRYRQTLAELQPALTSLDGAPLTRPEDHAREAARAAAVHASTGSSRGPSKKELPAPASAWPSAIGESALSLDDSTTAQRRERPPQPAPRAADADARHAHRSSSVAAMSTATTATSQVRRGVRGGGAAPQPPPSSSEFAAATPSSTQPPPPTSAPQHQPMQPTRNSVAPSPEPVAEASTSPTHADFGIEAETSGAQTANRHVDLDAAPTPSRTPEQQPQQQQQHSGGRRVGYAALHASPSSVPASSARRSVGGRAPTFRSPTTPARSAAEQELDSTTAQLHDSLVAKEQLEKECQALRHASRRAEAQLAEARRVVSQQLAELAQLRLERDALRESEGAALERLEKEKRAGRSRAAHHAEEVATLQAQYERMKTFYETQLADTRRELAAERARLLRQPSSGARGGGPRSASGERRPSPEGTTAAAPAETGTTTEKAMPAGTSTSAELKLACSSSVVVDSASAAGVAPHTSGAQPLPSAAVRPSVPSAEVVAQQLTQWLYASRAPTDASALDESGAAEATAVRELRNALGAAASDAKPHPHDTPQASRRGAAPTQPPPPSSAHEAEAGAEEGRTSSAIDAAARRVLEVYIAQHLAAPSSTAGVTAVHTRPAHQHAPGHLCDAVAQEQRDGLEAAADTRAAEGADGSVGPFPPPSRRRSPPLPPPPEAGLIREAMTAAAAVAAPRGEDEPPTRNAAAHTVVVEEEGEDDDSADLDTEVTVMIGPPAWMPTQRRPAAAVAVFPPPPPLPVPPPTRDDRVEAAKALLKGMEPLFED